MTIHIGRFGPAEEDVGVDSLLSGAFGSVVTIHPYDVVRHVHLLGYADDLE